jgi:5S rRNA maturation endonuclease (ribonuclease M5)
MPELWHKLGLRGDPKRSCFSPFRDNKNTPAFSVFQKHNQWFYKDQAIPDIHGDEIGLIELATGKETGEAIRFYHELAGIPMPETKPNPAKSSNNSLGKLVKIYDYRDADGNLVHQTLRYEPKRFLQRRPAAKDMHAGGKTARLDKFTGQWWIWTLEGIEPVLYRLPELARAPLDRSVFVCEGEKDADALAELGAVVTTAPMGAGKWRKSYTNALEKRNVIICPDEDEAGERHAQLVAGCLNGCAKSIAILRLATFLNQEKGTLTIDKIDIAEIVPILRKRNGTA